MECFSEFLDFFIVSDQKTVMFLSISFLLLGQRLKWGHQRKGFVARATCTRNIEVGAVIDSWNYPVKYFELRQRNFLKLIFNKEIYVRQSTEGSPCTDLEEETYYQVS